MNMKKGFTLVEIMIVVAIIAILAAIAIPNFVAYRKTAQMNACIANLKQLDSATEAWRIKEGKTETDIPEQTDLVGKTAGQGFIKTTLECPSGAAYTKPASATDHWTCANSTDSEYPHAIKD